MRSREAARGAWDLAYLPQTQETSGSMWLSTDSHVSVTHAQSENPRSCRPYISDTSWGWLSANPALDILMNSAFACICGMVWAPQ